MDSLQHTDMYMFFFKDCPNTLNQRYLEHCSPQSSSGTNQKDRTSRHKASPAGAHCVWSPVTWLDRSLRRGDRRLEEVAFRLRGIMYCLRWEHVDAIAMDVQSDIPRTDVGFLAS